MSHTTFVDLKVNNAEQFKESLTESSNTTYYLTFGKVTAWPNESSPNVANSSVTTYNEVWSNMIGGKRIQGGDVHHIIPRFNWTANTIYTAYDELSTNLYDSNTKFYAMNSDYSVYKCLSNNRSANSTVEPTSVNPSINSLTSDGYIWKYMYTISDSEKLRFTTDAYIPVKTLATNDGSLQWQVQDSAEDGSIQAVYLSNVGSNYTNTSNITISVSGDGSSFSASPTLNTTSNTISSITITNYGSGYTYANVTISDIGTGSGATARAIISPSGGHGKDALYELGGKNLIINTKLKYDEDGVLPITNEFRQIAIIKDAISSLTSNIATNTVFLQASSIITSGSGSYDQDEVVYQGTSPSAFVFKGKVVSYNSSTGKVILINTDGTPTAAQALIGVTSTTSRIIASITNGLLQKRTGKVIFVDNVKPITRSSDQIEDFRIILCF